jgi:chromosome segregation ATPase
MGVEVEVLTKPEFDGRCKMVDERCEREKERIESLEEASKKITELATQFAEIIKSDHEKSSGVCSDVKDLKDVSMQLSVVVTELQKKDEDKENRLRKVENEKSKKYDKLMGWVYGTIVTGVVGYLISLLLKLREVVN